MSRDESRTLNRPLTQGRAVAYDSQQTRLKDPEFPNAFCADQPSTYSYPRPYRPGEDGVLGFVRSVPPSRQRSPETRLDRWISGFFRFSPL
jgi:hypothetical protein